MSQFKKFSSFVEAFLTKLVIGLVSESLYLRLYTFLELLQIFAEGPLLVLSFLFFGLRLHSRTQLFLDLFFSDLILDDFSSHFLG